MNKAFPLHLWKKVKLQTSLKKELDVLGHRRTTSIWSGLGTGYSETFLHATHILGFPAMCQLQFWAQLLPTTKSQQQRLPGKPTGAQ